jgi:hypothetical protein
MNVIEQFGLKNGKKNPPEKSAMPAVPRTAPKQPDLHPDALKAMSDWSRDRERLKDADDLITELRIENEVLRRSCAELQHCVDNERGLKEQYMRYSVTSAKGLRDMARMADELNRTAIEDAERAIDKMVKAATTVDVEKEIAELSPGINAEAIGAKFGHNMTAEAMRDNPPPPAEIKAER